MVVLTFSISLFDLCQFLSAPGADDLNEGLLICSQTLDRKRVLLINIMLHIFDTLPYFTSIL